MGFGRGREGDKMRVKTMSVLDEVDQKRRDQIGNELCRIIGYDEKHEIETMENARQILEDA